MDVADAREQVMLDLVIEATDVRGQQPVVRAKFDVVAI